ncbi:Protein GAT2, partial [Leucoagaricus sp. SymC.cos]
LLESYKVILDNGEVVKSGGKGAPADLLEKMLQCATQASQILEQAIGGGSTTSSYSSLSGANGLPTTTPTTNLREDSKEGLVNGSTTNATNVPASLSSAANPTSPSGPPAKKQKTDEGNSGQGENQGQTCLGCNATSTPEWRRGPMGPRTLCNACGLVYAKMIKKRVREANSNGRVNGQASAQQNAAEDSGDGDSDEDDGPSPYPSDRGK